MNSKARITYRFDKETGTARLAQKPEEAERPAKANVMPFFQEELTFVSDIGAWNSPFQNDPQALEDLIRDTDRDTDQNTDQNTDRHTNRHTNQHIKQHADRLTGRNTDRNMVRDRGLDPDIEPVRADNPSEDRGKESHKEFDINPIPCRETDRKPVHELNRNTDRNPVREPNRETDYHPDRAAEHDDSHNPAWGIDRDETRHSGREMSRAAADRSPAADPGWNSDPGTGRSAGRAPRRTNGPAIVPAPAARYSAKPAQHAAPTATNQQPSRRGDSVVPPHSAWGMEEDLIPLGDETFVPSPVRETDHYPIVEWDEDENDDYKKSGRAGSGKLGSFQTAVNYRSGRNPSWFKVFASVTGAIVTGAIFGYFALALFSGETPADKEADTNLPAASVSADTAGDGSAAANSRNPDSAGSGATDTGGKSAGATGQAGGTGTAVKVDIPAASYAMLQYGVFSSEDGMNAAVAELESKGLAAASLTSDQDYRIYVGLAANRDEALALSQALPGMDVYVKDIAIPALKAISYNGKAEEAEAFIKQTGELIALMDGSTIKLLEGQSGTIDADWSGQHQQWLKAASTIESGLSDKTGKAALLQLVQKVNTAAVAAQEYNKKSSTAHLWAMQTALMEAVFAQKAWFASMDAL